MWWITFLGEKHHSKFHPNKPIKCMRSAFSSLFIRYIINCRSSDLLQTEEPYNLSERRSSSDSNKPSSGEVSPYDNNSPVLSERRGEPGSPGSEQNFHIPGQYSLAGQVAGWGREPRADTWGSKGEFYHFH